MTEVTITEDIVEASVEEVKEVDDGMEAVEVTTTNGEVSVSPTNIYGHNCQS